MKSSLDVLKQDAPYLDSTKNKLMHIGFLTAFTIIFLTVYSPFNISEWDGSITGYVVVGSSILVVNHFLIRPVFGLKKLKLYQLIIIGAAEVLITAFGIYLFFGPEFPSLDQKVDEYLLTLKYVCLIVVSPYLLSLWFIASQQKLKSIQNSTLTNSLSSKKSILISVKGENDKVVFAINSDQVVFVKSAGNYLEIHYLDGEIVSKELVRMSLKELEAMIANSGLLKIHRSYIINTQRISSFKKTRKGYDLKVQCFPHEALPVSSGYKANFEEALALNVSH